MLTLVALFGLMITPVFANGTVYESTLIAGQHHNVGEVTIYFNDAHTLMYVKLETQECSIIETHLWVGTDLEGVPRTRSGNPKIGHFPYAGDHEDGTKEVIYEIPVKSGQTYHVLVHSVVDCPGLGEETAWGQGDYAIKFSERSDIFGRRWGYFIGIWV